MRFMDIHAKKRRNFPTASILLFVFLLVLAIYLYTKADNLSKNYAMKNDTAHVEYVPPTVKPTHTVEEIKERIIELVNDERIKGGFKPLSNNQLLDKSAELKAKDIVDKNYWSHNSPEGTEPWHFFQKVGYVYQEAGENLARGYFSGDEIVDSWMNSQTHKDNILTTRYTDIGIGIAYSPVNGRIVVAHFGSPRKTYNQ